MKLIIGLGNPGLRYRNTRHNVGFLVIREISKSFNMPLRKKKYNGLLGKGAVEGEKLALFMPETFMNLSGKAVSELVVEEKVMLDNALIICDDINLKTGFIRLRKKGSAGGHNGITSIIEELGTEEFPRLRIGIGRDGEIADVARFVLRPFSFAEKALIKDAIKQAAECAITWVKEGPDKAMLLFNKRQG